MSNLLLITDVARLRKIFGRLTEDQNIRLRVVNNLEKGGEEIAIEKPDVVFVQTHLSGLSTDILIMHLKKQLGRKRSRFVLLSTPNQVNDVVLKPYQGWLDTSADDSHFLSELQQLLVTLLGKPMKSVEHVAPGPIASADFVPQPLSAALLVAPIVSPPAADTASPQLASSGIQLPIATPAAPELSLEEQGITYPPRQRISVYSEFNSSFDSAVSSTPEPEPLEQAPPTTTHVWKIGDIDTVETKPKRSKKGAFLLWLVPVVVMVIVITYFQQQPTPKPEPAAVKAVSATAKTAPHAVVKPAEKTPAPSTPIPSAAVPAKAPVATTAAPSGVPPTQDRMSDNAVLNAIAENRGSKSPATAASSSARPTKLPDFIPSYGLDKKYSTDNPGWERYKGQVTEFKVLREGPAIKAIQVIDRGGNGVPESFMKAVLRQVAKKPVPITEASEKKDGYEIQRGHISDNIKVVYYRDENGGKLRAFVLTWQ